jgi:trehalose-phosphatase
MMVPLSTTVDHLLSKLADAGMVAIGLDYDGTLVPIKETPAEAVLSQRARGVLAELIKGEGIQLLLISGRWVRDLENLIGIEGLEMVGNHGLSRIRGGNLVYHPDAESFMQSKEIIIHRLKRYLPSMPCVLLEDKGAGFALHYRPCPEQEHGRIRSGLLTACRDLEKDLPLKLREGKKVVELIPVTNVNKGGVMLDWIEKLCGSGDGHELAVVFAGDDITDEDVFRVAGANWITIQVGNPGNPNVSARFNVKDQDELLGFLSFILKARASKRRQRECG